MPDCSPCCPERLMLMEPSSDDTLTTVRVRFFLMQRRSKWEPWIICIFISIFLLPGINRCSCESRAHKAKGELWTYLSKGKKSFVIRKGPTVFTVRTRT